jgi:hypothetical protein
MSWWRVGDKYYQKKIWKISNHTSIHCDIVTFEYFEKYLQTVDYWLAGMNKSFVDYYKLNYA